MAIEGNISSYKRNNGDFKFLSVERQTKTSISSFKASINGYLYAAASMLDSELEFDTEFVIQVSFLLSQSV